MHENQPRHEETEEENIDFKGGYEEDEDIIQNIDTLKILYKETYPEDVVQLYFKNISAYKPLSLAEEKALGEKIKEGDKEALKKLILSNLKFVVSIAHKYKNTGVPLPDIINQGNIGLIEAAKRYDPEKNVKFITYAVWWIRQAIIHGLSNQTGSVKLPLKQANNLYKINSSKERLTKELKREPTVKEISKASGINEDEIDHLVQASKKHLSLDAATNDEEDNFFIDNLEDENSSVEKAIIEKTMRDAIDEIISYLDEREASIINMRFGMDDGTPKTLEEIGKVLNLSRERVRQLEARAMDKLKKKALKKRLNDFLN